MEKKTIKGKLGVMECLKNGKLNKPFIKHMLACLHFRCFKRNSQAALNRQQELSHLPVPPQLRLYDYLQRRKERKPAPVDLKISKVGNVSSQHSHTGLNVCRRQSFKPPLITLCIGLSQWQILRDDKLSQKLIVIAILLGDHFKLMQ